MRSMSMPSMLNVFNVPIFIFVRCGIKQERSACSPFRKPALTQCSCRWRLLASVLWFSSPTKGGSLKFLCSHFFSVAGC